MGNMIMSAGTHVTIDAYVQDATTFQAEHLVDLFHILVAALDMRLLKGPDVIEVPVDPKILERAQETGKFEDEGGTTAICVISTSHMAIHCWPLQRFFSMDLFSCCDFDPQIALTIVQRHMGVVRDRIHILRRKKPFSELDGWVAPPQKLTVPRWRAWLSRVRKRLDDWILYG